MKNYLRLVFAVVLDKKIVKVVQTLFVPNVGKVGRGSQGVGQHEVLVVFIVGLAGLTHETEPDTPLIVEQGV
jgi:hypothetical protein